MKTCSVGLVLYTYPGYINSCILGLPDCYNVFSHHLDDRDDQSVFWFSYDRRDRLRLKELANWGWALLQNFGRSKWRTGAIFYFMLHFSTKKVIQASFDFHMIVEIV